MSTVQIYTDGSGTTADKPGGWACILVSGSRRKEMSGRLEHATNNIAELTAVIKGLEALMGTGHDVTIYTDSQYTIKAIEGIRKPTANFDLLTQINKLTRKHHVRAIWVQGHNGHPENERCDVLANSARIGVVSE